MKRIVWTMIAVSMLLVAAAGCSPAATATPIPTVPLDTGDTSSPGQVQASGVAVPAQETHLSFVISGLIKEVTVKEGDQVQTGQALAVLDTTKLEYGVSAAEYSLYAAQLDATVQRYRRKLFGQNGKVIYLSGPREKILAADAKVEQMQSALDTAKASLAQGTLLAPFEGTVVEVNVSPGEYIQTAQRVLVIADLKNLLIETTDLSERDIPPVELGQSAVVYVEALDAEFNGKVTAISPISNTVGGDVVYKVTVTLDEQPVGLFWGMNAEVKIDTGQ